MFIGVDDCKKTNALLVRELFNITVVLLTEADTEIPHDIKFDHVLRLPPTIEALKTVTDSNLVPNN
jgi:hypothetical protein